MTNKEITQAIVAIILEEVNGFSREEAIEDSKEYNGSVEDRIQDLLDENRNE